MSNWMNFRKEFENFLKEKDCLEVFKLEVIIEHECGTLEEYLLDTPVIDWITNAFKWCLNSKGHEYWQKVSTDFHRKFLGL
jgi:hypothetical protein